MGSKRSYRKSSSSKRHAKRTSSKGVKRGKFSRVTPPGMRSFDAIGSSVEKKYLDSAVTSSVGNGTLSTVQCLTLVPQGTSAITREGARITVVNVNIHGTLEFRASNAGSAGTHQAACVRALLVADTQTNGALFDTDTLLTIPAVNVTAKFNAFRNIFTGGRFVILKEKWFVFNPQAYVSSEVAEVLRKFSMSWKGRIPISFSSSTGAIAELLSNSISLVFITSETTANGNYVVANAIARVKFTDL